MKRRLIAFLLVLTVLVSLALPVFADDGDDTDDGVLEVEKCQSAYLYNIEYDQVLFEHNASKEVYPASTVKLMTAIVVYDHFKDSLDTKITVTYDMLSEVSGNKIGFSAGEVVTVEEMLACMLVNSANDAAIILAYATAGDTKSFVRLMNEKATEIGCFNTYYTNPTGMHDPAMITTAKDTAIIAKCAYEIEGLADITVTPKYVMAATNMCDYRSVYNRNGLVAQYYVSNYFYSGAVGLNAGATSQGGYAIAGVAEDKEEGLTYIAVVLGAEDDEGSKKIYSYENCIRMFDWAFEQYGMRTVLPASRVICETPVNLSSTLDYVTLVPEKDITVFLPTAVNIAEEIRYSYNTYADSLDAPIEAGQEAGTVTVLYGDKILGSCALVTTSSITRSEFLNFLSKVKNFTSSRFFIAMIVTAVILSLAYVFLKAARRESKLKKLSGGRH